MRGAAEVPGCMKNTAFCVLPNSCASPVDFHGLTLYIPRTAMFPRPKLAPAGLSRLALAACMLMLAGLPARAQDRIVFKDNRVQEGKVTGMTGNSVLITIKAGAGAGQAGYDLAMISRVDVAPPPAFQTGYAAYQAGEWDKALAALKPVVDQFKGLPTEWERQAVGALGDIYLEKNDIAKAEAAYNDYRKYYAAGAVGGLRGNLAQARIAFARNNADLAKKSLEPILQAALKNPAQVNATDGAAYGQAFYLMAQLNEREGGKQAALENYLRAVTLFYQDKATAANAQKKADALRAANKELTVP
jgi:tetratricopeptide (TPR) repeat protein